MNSITVSAQHLGLFGSAYTVGIHFSCGELEANHRFACAWSIEQVQVKKTRDIVAHGESADGVAAAVKGRRKHADAQLARQHRDEAAGHAALGRHSHPVKPLSGII